MKLTDNINIDPNVNITKKEQEGKENINVRVDHLKTKGDNSPINVEINQINEINGLEVSVKDETLVFENSEKKTEDNEVFDESR